MDFKRAFDEIETCVRALRVDVECKSFDHEETKKSARRLAIQSRRIRDAMIAKSSLKMKVAKSP